MCSNLALKRGTSKYLYLAKEFLFITTPIPFNHVLTNQVSSYAREIVGDFRIALCHCLWSREKWSQRPSFRTKQFFSAV